MRRRIVFLSALCAWLLLRGAVLAAGDGTADQANKDRRIGRGEVRISLVAPIEKPVEIGQSLSLDLAIAYRDLPAKSRIYAHLMTLDNNRWITLGGAFLSAEAPTFSFSGKLAQADHNFFHFGAGNYPVSALFDRKALAQTLTAFTGKKDFGEEMAESISNRPEGYDVILAFLAATGANEQGFENARLSFKVPDYPHYYDGILIAPIVVLYNEDGSQTAYFSGKNMTTVRVPVAPNRPKPIPSPDRTATSSDEIPGIVQITGYNPSNAVLATGRSNSIELHVRYQKFMPGTAVYIAMIPVEGDKYLLGPASVSISNIKGTTEPIFIDGESEIFRIPGSARPIRISLPFFGGQETEGALATVMQSGGDGEVDCSVTFTPPAYARRYDRIHLIPLLLVPTTDGLQLLIDTERLQGPRLLVSEG